MQATAVPPNATVERRGFSLNGALVAIVEIILILGALALILSAALGHLSSPGSTTGSAPIGLMPALGLLLVALLILRGFRLMRRDQALVLFSGSKYLLREIRTPRPGCGSGLIRPDHFRLCQKQGRGQFQ